MRARRLLVGAIALGAWPFACSDGGGTGTFPSDASADGGTGAGGSAGAAGSGGSTAGAAGSGAGAGGSAGAPIDAGSDVAPGGDTCGNGLDDDGDGEVDELCVCDFGTSQPCYGGPPSKAGVGVCAFGTQFCTPGGAPVPTGVWLTCEGWTAHGDEDCNLLDDDCNGSDDDDAIAFCVEGGQRTCDSGTWSACEQCNGGDENGNGEFDEGLLRGCTDGCSETGFQTCESTTWTPCVPTRTFDPSIDRGGVEVDAVTIAGGDSVDALVLSHTTSGTLSNRLLLAGVALDSPATISSVTYGGKALTKVASWTADSGFVELRVEVFYLVDPAAGAADLAISLAEPRTIRAGVYSMGNVGDVPKLLGAAKDRTTEPKYTASVTPAGLVVDFIGKEANHEISPAPRAELGWDFCGPGYARFGSSIRTASGPTNLFWDFYCCPDEWILGAVLVTQAG